MSRLALLVALACSLLSGCAAGPSYAGGPAEEEPHAVVIPGPYVFLLRVDGVAVPGRSSEALVAPGRHRLTVRFEYPIDSEAQTPRETKDLDATFEDGRVYDIIRTGDEGEYGPWSVELRERRARE